MCALLLRLMELLVAQKIAALTVLSVHDDDDEAADVVCAGTMVAWPWCGLLPGLHAGCEHVKQTSSDI